MHDFNFQVGFTDPPMPKAAAIRPCANSFVTNLQRVKHSLQILPYLVKLARDWERAEYEVVNGIGTDKYGQERREKVRDSEVKYQTEEMMKYWEAGQNPLSVSEYYVYPATLVGLFCSKLGDTGRLGVSAIILSAFVQTWTAFETLACDVWVKALDARPILASNAAAPKPSASAKGVDPKTIPIKLLQKYNYDLRSVMGTVLKEQKKFDFNSLNGIGKAYKAAFGKAADAIFSPNNHDHQKLAWLEAIRNVIVHNAGLADKMFLERVKGHAGLGSLKIGDAFPADGNMLAENVLVTAKFSATVLSLVDVALSQP
jgi:hypothetical protein